MPKHRSFLDEMYIDELYAVAGISRPENHEQKEETEEQLNKMAPNGGHNIKWMTAISVWLFVAMTSAMVTAKVSLLWILRLYKYEQIHPATWYVVMLVLLEVPLVCHAVHLVWNTPFINGSRTPLPSKSLIVLGVLSSIMESVAGAVFATEVSYVLPEPILLLLPAAVFTLHLMLSTGGQIKTTQRTSELKSDVFGGSLAASSKASFAADWVADSKANGKMQEEHRQKVPGQRPWHDCAGILLSSYLLWAPAAVAAVVHVWSPFNMKLGACLALPSAMLVLSAAWAPRLQAAVAGRRRGRGDRRGVGANRNSGLSLVYTLFRVSSVPVTLYLLMVFKIDAFRNDVMGFLHHVSTDVTDPRVWLPLLLTSLFGLAAVMLGGVASKVALLTPGMRIPALVAPFLSLGAATLLWRDLDSGAFWELSGSDAVTWTASGVAALAWLVTFLVPGVPATQTPRQLLRPFSRNFLSFTWRPFFLEPHLMLNTHGSCVDDDSDDGDDEHGHRHQKQQQQQRGRGSAYGGEGPAGSSGKGGIDAAAMKTVYICTTMFRETQSEMRRYLNSLRKAFTSDRLGDVELEGHIFLDNCVEKDLYVNRYARQLLALLTTVLHVPPSALFTRSTPYGCQVSCRCVGGHRLFVHFKNGQEFKPKKRWSQVMYMNYILNHRATRHQNETRGNGDDKWTDSGSEKNGAARSTDSNLTLAAGHLSSQRTEKENGDGKIWFSTEQLLPFAASEALQMMFKGNPGMLEAVPAMRPEIARTTKNDESSGSESAIGSSHDTGSDEGPETCPVSMESATSCDDCSDADDDSEVFTFHNRSSTTPAASGAKDSCPRKKKSPSLLPGSGHYSERTSGAKNGFCSSASTASTESDNNNADRAKQSQTPLCNLHHAGRGVSHEDSRAAQFWANSNRHQQQNTAAAEASGSGPSTSRVYILATDADTEFSDMSVRTLLDQCEADLSLGAVCGRTVPVGGLKPIVWYQKFEYAKDFWLVKSSQNVIGSVTCCPGCFSLYRGAALRDVMSTFSRPSASAYDTLVKDHGEDRWLCTLLMQKGWKLEYADNSYNSTHCPETFGEFLRQRRRWVLSELSNTLLIFQGLGQLVKGNATFSAVFILSLFHMFVWVLLSPSTTLVVTCAGLHVLFRVPMLYSAPVAFCLLLAFFVVCVTQPRSTQRMVTQAIVALMVAVMVTISAGFVDYVVETLKRDVWAGQVEFKPYFLVLVLIGGTVWAAILHASEGITLLYGLVYAATFPAMFLALPIYSTANMVDTSWGTRELTGTQACCDVMMDEADDNSENEWGQFRFRTSDLPALSAGSPEQAEEHRFWTRLRRTLLGTDVNLGESDRDLRRELFVLRNRCVFGLFVINAAWYALLTSVYVFVNSDAVCYVIASLFSFSLILQLIGMTSYKVDELLKRYVVGKMQGSDSFWVRHKS